MFLKRIELSGFKSFADKTELEFVPGITAVVGPNGSGKSNISDGIRWVLGEQSAKSLRGGKMEDIIFAGSDTRKAVNYSEVSLTLDNTDEALPLDYSEVTVTRRVHRSGESEYFINKQACRLRDITELFMDTGIGKEAYSIIGQGKIEEILSTRSEDRRTLFEEASGIVKYKARKKEAQKKLDETEQNLLRIHDLVSELEGQIEPLREQAEKAKTFKELKEQLKSNEISLYVHQIEQLHASWKEANGKLSVLQDEQLELSVIVGRHDAQLEQHRSELRKLEQQLDELQQSLLILSEEAEKAEGQTEVLKERRRHLEQTKQQTENLIQSQQSKITEREAERQAYAEKLSLVEADWTMLQQELAAEEERLYGIAALTNPETEDGLKAELLDTMNKVAQHRNTLRFGDQQAETLGRRMNHAAAELARQEKLAEQVAAKRTEANKHVQELAENITSLRSRLVELNQELLAGKQKMESAQQDIRKGEQKIDALVSRRDTMKEMQSDYDGFAIGVKEVLKARARNGLRGIQGAVAELISVPAKLELAVEIALGGALQHIVVDDEASGRAALAFLKGRQLGRATVLPLDVMKPRTIPNADLKSAESIDGFVGVAARLVSFDGKYENVLGNLLGNVLVAGTLEQANRIAARCQYRYRVVTLEGEVVHAGGSMTGGSMQKKAASLLGRERQIEQLNEEIQQAEADLSDLQAKAASVRQEHDDILKKMESLREEGEQKRIDEQRAIAEHEKLDVEHANLISAIAAGILDLESHRKEMDEWAVQKRGSEEALLKLQAEQNRLQDDISRAESTRKESAAAKEQAQTLLTDLKVKAAAKAQEKQSLHEQVERLDAELRVSSSGIEQERLALSQAIGDLALNDEEIVRQIELGNDAKLRRQKCAEQIEFARAERSDKQQKLEQEENHTREQRVRLKQVEEQLRQIEIQANRLDVELDNLLRKLAEDYELSFELAKERYPVPDDIPAMQSVVRELRRSIAALGEVNLGSIEEFQRVSERFEFLSRQKADLIEAKTTLYHVINEIDEEMSNRFKAAFDEIRANFSVVFAKLFGGGRADLILSEPDNLLETGIEIVAQPPGKKLQNLMLLSGGERALTALALLFSILTTKPVPFCVLDEVEAALDEANVSRFVDYLREFSAQTQFIVVTHRKRTMEGADVLYGVTMEEGGVSKLVSVRLEDEEPVSA